MKSFVEIYVQNREIRYAVKNKKVAHSIFDEKRKQWAIIGKLQSIFFKMVDIESKFTNGIVFPKVGLTICPKIMV